MNARFVRVAGLLAKFGAGQATLQGLQALNGLMLVWLLEVNEFAVYAIFTAAMGFSSMIMGLNITPIVLSFVGADVHDKGKVGRYLYAGLQLRFWILWPVAIAGLGLLFYSAHRIGYASQYLLLLGVCLIASTYIASQLDLFGAPLQMLGRLGKLYQRATAAEVVKILIIIGFWAGGVLDDLAAIVAAVAGLAVNYFDLLRFVRPHIEKPRQPPVAERRELWHLALPGLPNAIFGALQGQATIIISGLLGSTQQIASVGALGRLSRIMSFLQAANAMIVGPAMAQMNPAAFWRRLPAVLLAALFFAVSIASSGLFAPQLLLKLLGPSYSELGHVVWIVTLGAGLGYLVSVVGTVVTYRRWVAWWASFATIGAVVVAQILVVVTFDLRTVAGALLLGVAATLARLIVLSSVTAVARLCPGWLRSVSPR